MHFLLLLFARDIVEVNVLNSERFVLPGAVVADNGDRSGETGSGNDGSIWELEVGFHPNERCFDDLFCTKRNDQEIGVRLKGQRDRIQERSFHKPSRANN